MTATATSTTQATSEWVKVFHKRVIENYTSSVTFMKQLTVVAVSTIAYLKNILPDDSYTVETFGGVKMRILKKKCKNEMAQFLSTTLTQAFEAFDKKFLHRLAVCFYDNECKAENLIEYQVFEYSYNDDSVTMNVHSKHREDVRQSITFENVRERTVHLLRACVVFMQTNQKALPYPYDVSLRLYYNEDAPVDYQAPGFLSTNESEDHLKSSLPATVKVGWVETPFHKMVAWSYIKEMMADSHEAIPSQNHPTLSNGMQSSGSDNEVQIVCPCNKYGDKTDDVRGLLKCYYCGTYQHALCFGVCDVTRVPRHRCAACHDREPNTTPTDQKLVGLSAVKRESLCIYRRTLEWCSHVSAIDVDSVAQRFQLSKGTARKLMKLLHSHGIVAEGPSDDTHEPQKIVTEALKVALKNFFNMNETIVDQLMAETLLESDLLTDVINPLEQVCLTSNDEVSQTPTNNSKVSLTSANISKQTDVTLMQYKEAFSNDNDVKLDVKTTKRKLDERNLRKGVRTKRSKS